MLTIGSKVKPTINSSYYLDMVGTVIFIDSKYKTMQVRTEISSYFNKGQTLVFFERDLELIKPTIDLASQYQYCSKCDVLTSNKPNLCCEHK